MINREDMLELTRRMTPSRTCFSRIAGCYMDKDGFEDGSFNTHFLKLSESDKKKNLDIAKTIPFAKTNEELKECEFAKGTARQNSMWQLLTGIKNTGLKDDGLLSILYEMIAEQYQTDSDYAIFVFHGSYDVPVKASDKERLDDSEEVYDFIICSVAPLIKEYELGKPQFGFLFPAFSDRSSDSDRIDIYDAGREFGQVDVIKRILGK